MNKKKEKTEHSLISNMLFFIKLMFKASPLLVIGEFVWGILANVPNSLIGVIGVKYIIDVMTSGERLNRIFLGNRSYSTCYYLEPFAFVAFP